MKDGLAIKHSDGEFNIPDNPIIPYIVGDGTGPDIWAAAVRVLDSAVAKAFDGAVVKDGKVWLDNVMSRKKEMVPNFEKAFK